MLSRKSGHSGAPALRLATSRIFRAFALVERRPSPSSGAPLICWPSPGKSRCPATWRPQATPRFSADCASCARLGGGTRGLRLPRGTHKLYADLVSFPDEAFEASSTNPLRAALVRCETRSATQGIARTFKRYAYPAGATCITSRYRSPCFLGLDRPCDFTLVPCPFRAKAQTTTG
jgi:hypothetical protein